MAELHVNYVKFANLNDIGEEKDINYGLHIFNDYSELVTEHAKSFDELKLNVDYCSLLDYISSMDNDTFLHTLEENGGLYFNRRWTTSNDLKKAKLVKECNNLPFDKKIKFENMSVTELEYFLNLIQNNYESLFGEEKKLQGVI